MRVPDPRCDGALHVTVTCSLPVETPVIVGAVGKVETAGELREAGDVPIKFLAEILN